MFENQIKHSFFVYDVLQQHLSATSLPKVELLFLEVFTYDDAI